MNFSTLLKRLIIIYFCFLKSWVMKDYRKPKTSVEQKWLENTDLKPIHNTQLIMLR